MKLKDLARVEQLLSKKKDNDQDMRRIDSASGIQVNNRSSAIHLVPKDAIFLQLVALIKQGLLDEHDRIMCALNDLGVTSEDDDASPRDGGN